MAPTTGTASTAIQSRSFGSADQMVRKMGELGQAEIIHLGDTTAVRATFQPGFHWTEHVKPIAGTDLCQVRHVGYVVSGRSRIQLSDGTECELKTGDVFDVPPGHDAWTVGNEPYVAIDFTAAQNLLSSGSAETTPPDHHTVLLDNEYVRVLDVRIPPAATSGRHSHPRSVVYQMSEARVRMSLPDGTSREVQLEPGQITWNPGGVHTIDNLGGTDDWGIIVELKGK